MPKAQQHIGRSRGLVLASALAGLVLATACSGATAPEAEGQPETPPVATTGEQGAATAPAPTGGDGPQAATELRVGLLRFACCVTPVIAQDLGYFDEEGLSVTFTELSGGAEGVAAMEAGALDITHSPYVSLMQARAEGFDIVALMTDNASPEEPPHEAAVLVRTDGDIDEYADLEGRRVAVNNLASVQYLVTAAAMRAVGADDTTVDWVELDNAQMVDAILQGQFDAVATNEPATTLGLETGELEVLSYPYIDVAPGLDIGAFVSTREFAEGNPEAVEAFTRAVKRAHQYLEDNPDEVPQLMADATNSELEQVESITLPVWPQSVNVGALEQFIELAVDFGFVEEAPNPDDFLWPTAH